MKTQTNITIVVTCRDDRTLLPPKQKSSKQGSDYYKKLKQKDKDVLATLSEFKGIN